MYNKRTFLIPKKHKIIILSIIGIILITLLIIFIPRFVSHNHEVILKEKMNNIGKDFYTNYYYPELIKNYEQEDGIKSLKEYEGIGLKINLNNLENYESETYDIEEELKVFINQETNQPCDYEETYIRIYPKEPYGAEDFVIDTKIKC